MKNYFKNSIKLWAPLLGVFLTLTNCNKELEEIQVLEQERIESVDSPISYVLGKDVPEVINSITSITGKSTIIGKTSKSKWINYKKTYIDINKILKVKNNESLTNYSFSISVEHSPINEFYNLIVNRDDKGELKSPYVIKYVVDDDALDTFLMNNKDFRYFKGKQYIMPFQEFFKGKDVFSKSSTTGDCIQEVGVDNTGNGSDGDFYDIPNNNAITTNPGSYDYAPYSYGESYILDLNSYGYPEGNTSHGDTVRDTQFSVNVLTSQGYTPLTVNAPITSSDSLPIGISITTSYNSAGGITSITITTIHGGGSSSTRIIWLMEPREHLDKQQSASKTQNDCAEVVGEIGVNTIDLAINIRNALGIRPRSYENLWLLGNTTDGNKASILQLISLYDYIAINTNEQGVLAAEAKEFAIEIIDSGVDNTLVFPFPFIKYPLNSGYESAYPKFTEYLKNKLPNITNISKIINTIKIITGLSESQIKEDLTWGKGPTIHITQLDNYSSTTSEKTVGLFSPTEADVIHVDIDYVNELENLITDQSQEDAFLFFLGTTILHEYVHYGDNQDGVEFRAGVEEGNLFEFLIYGENVNPTNAIFILEDKQ
tara:strand:- start:30043 stop:31839 length:1797 start_codon:yes stop_codon:yes gene_type:complete